MLFIESDKKYSTPIWSRVLALARRYSSSELLGALRNSSLLETVTTDVTDKTNTMISVTVELESIESIDLRREPPYCV